MKCPTCGAWSLVLETRASTAGATRRRYACANGDRFTTKEVVVPERQRIPAGTTARERARRESAAA